MRLMHEKRMHSESAFLTLTYDQRHLPSDLSLQKRDVQLFMKRLRKERPAGLRFYACGEYGETTWRPHYHVLLLNSSFPDMRPYKVSKSGEQLFESAELNLIWSNGSALIGHVTFESCAYVARYVTKKISGDRANSHYQGRAPEFALMSRRPGIGYAWYMAYGDDAYRHDSAVVRGHEVGLPRYYDTKLEAADPKRMTKIKRDRRAAARAHADDNTPERRKAIEAFETSKAALFKREAT